MGHAIVLCPYFSGSVEGEPIQRNYCMLPIPKNCEELEQEHPYSVIVPAIRHDSAAASRMPPASKLPTTLLARGRWCSELLGSASQPLCCHAWAAQAAVRVLSS